MRTQISALSFLLAVTTLQAQLHLTGVPIPLACPESAATHRGEMYDMLELGW